MNITKFFLPVAFLGLLAGCFPTIPDRLDFRVVNGLEADGNVTCSGGLKAIFEAGSLRIESPRVAPLDGFRETLQPLPNNVGIGTPVKIEAWCYDADNLEATGYVRIEQPWQANSTNSVGVYPGVGEDATCARAVERTAPAPCIDSFLLEDE